MSKMKPRQITKKLIFYQNQTFIHKSNHINHVNFSRSSSESAYTIPVSFRIDEKIFAQSFQTVDFGV